MSDLRAREIPMPKSVQPDTNLHPFPGFQKFIGVNRKIREAYENLK